MKHGDISNLPAPTVILDSQLLLEWRKKKGFLGRFQRELVPLAHTPNCLYWLSKWGINVWVVCLPGTKMEMGQVIKTLSDHNVIFNMVFEDTNGMALGVYSRLEWVHGVFYLHTEEHPSKVVQVPYMASNKYFPVASLDEVLNRLR